MRAAALGLLLAALVATPLAGAAPGEVATAGAEGSMPDAGLTETPVSAAQGTERQALSDACLLRQLEQAGDDVTVAEIRAACAEEQALAGESLLLGRLRREEAAEEITSLLTPHKANYFLPVTYAKDPNLAPFANELGEILTGNDLDNVETKFQLSLKFSLAGDLLLPRDRLYFGFTTLAFWQAYNRNVSAPFRETNYEPELFWTTPVDWGPFDLDAGLITLGLSHQSNGRGGTLSRSWNRVYANFQFEKERLVVSLKPWWRIPEGRKDDPLDADGDDNPDIEKYLGYFELASTYRRRDHELSLMLRNNLRSDNRGAVQLEWTFPLWRGIRGYAQYFNGYGESLIDYDASMERIGIGILLNDLL